MKLHYSPTSPYARKVRVVIVEHGLQDRVELIAVNPLEPAAADAIPNPLGKVPVLTLDDGSLLHDSPVICRFLLSLAGIAPSAVDWQSMRREALGNGVIDAAFNAVMERRRPHAQQSPLWLERWEAAIGRSLRAMEQEAGALEEGFDLVAITWACALGYLDFRLPHLAWRAICPRLAAGYQAVSARESLGLTAPD